MRKPIAFSRYLQMVAPTLALTAAQAVLVLVCFDGVEPGALDEAQRTIAERLFGALDAVPAAARTVVAWVKGARIGGTLLCALRLLHLALTVALPTLATGSWPAPSSWPPTYGWPGKRSATRSARRRRTGRSRSKRKREDSFVIVRPDGKRVSIECLPATRGLGAARPDARRGDAVGGVVPEGRKLRRQRRGAFPRDPAAHRARRQVLIESTPFAELGLLYELHAKNFAAPRARW